MHQNNLFDIQTARKLRDQGIDQVSENNEHFLKVARDIAKRICAVSGTVTMDQVREMCPLEPLHQNAWGGVLRDPCFEWTGKYVQSKAISRRGGVQRQWRLAKGGNDGE